MSKTISNFKNDLEGTVHGATTNKITNLNSLLNRGASQLLLDIDPNETIRKQAITNSIYSKVYDYPIPSDVKGNKILDIRPQSSPAGRTRNDEITNYLSKDFDRFKDWVTNKNGLMTFRFDTGVKSIRIAKEVNPVTVLNECNSLTLNGTWTAGDDASNLTVDKSNFISGGASLNFDLDGSSTSGYIEVTDMNSVDLSDEEDIASLFEWFYLPDTSIITSINLRWGNDDSNYWDTTITTQSFGAFENGWNQGRHNWNGASETGSPDSSDITYLRFTINYDGTVDTDFRLDNVSVSIGEIYDLEYYSKFLFKTSGGTWQETTTDDTDIINLDTDSYNCYLWKIAEYTAQQLPDYTDVGYFKNNYTEAISKYKSQYPSQFLKTKSQYYRDPQRTRRPYKISSNLNRRNW